MPREESHVIRALYSAASGMIAQQTNIETVSNNLANVNTTGYKKGRSEFQDLLYAQVRPAVQGAAEPGLNVGQGTRLSSIHRIFSGGAMQVTGNPLDVAIQGEGFFRVRRADGTDAYTRDGSLHLDEKRRLTTANGDLVMSRTGPITIPADAAENFEIGADGTIRYTKDNQVNEVGRISLTVFTNPAGLTPAGDNLWLQSDASGIGRGVFPGDRGAGRLAQNYLEGSNVQTVEEMVNLITAQRAYEINSKVVQSADEMMSLANNLRRG